MRLDVHHYFHDDRQDAVMEMLTRISAQVDELEPLAKELRELMSEQFDNLEASLDSANTSLDEVASDLNQAVADIEALQAQLASGLNPEQTQQAQAKVDALKEKIAGIAKIIDPAVDPGEGNNG